jgi:hypothetical protein
MSTGFRFRRSVTLMAAATIAAPLAVLAAHPALAAGTAPTITVTFDDSQIALNGVTAINFEVADVDVSTTNAAFSLTLPSGLVVSTPNGQAGTCAAGTVISAIAGSSAISMSGADLDAETACDFSINVTGTTDGFKTVTTSAPTADGDPAGVAASASITVGSRGCRSYTGESYIGAVVLNADGTPIGCGLSDTAEGAPADLTPAGWPTTDVDFTAMIDDENGGSGATYSSRLGYACDDCSVGADGVDAGGAGLPLGFPINFFGTTYNDVFVNSNGSVSFGAGSDNYNDTLNNVLDGSPGVVVYGVDLYNGDLADGASMWGSGRQPDFFYWGRTTYQGHSAFVATWMNMRGCCDDNPAHRRRQRQHHPQLRRHRRPPTGLRLRRRR